MDSVTPVPRAEGEMDRLWSEVDAHVATSMGWSGAAATGAIVLLAGRTVVLVAGGGGGAACA